MQAIVKRWQQLFRDSFCGEDAALEARIREALMHEPDLHPGIGFDDALMAYLHKAHIVDNDMAPPNAGPKPSAMMVATQRAAHQLLDHPLVLDDPIALTLLGSAEAQSLRDDLDRFRHPASVGLRSAVVVRSRLADNVWIEAVERDIDQYVILGAGLDTSAYRQPVSLAASLKWICQPCSNGNKRACMKQVFLRHHHCGSFRSTLSASALPKAWHAPGSTRTHQPFSVGSAYQCISTRSRLKRPCA